LVSFSNAEAALVSELISNVSAFTADNCKAHDLDAVMKYALSNSDVYYFAWTDFVGGRNMGRGLWQHLVMLSVGILFRDDATQMDDDIRSIIDDIYDVLVPDTNLGGAVASCNIIEVMQPESWLNQENNIPYVLVNFRISLEESMGTC